MKKVSGTLDGYGLDCWQKNLDLDVSSLQKQMTDSIQMRQDSMPLNKLEQTELRLGLDKMISSHETSYPKEHPAFWTLWFERFEPVPSRCIFIDDSKPILATARHAAVGCQLGINKHDCQKPHKTFSNF